MSIEYPKFVLSITKVTFPIRGHFTISRGSRTEAHTVQVTLSSLATARLPALTGRGECLPYPRYNETPDTVVALLQDNIMQIQSVVSRLDLQQLLPSGAARNAVDCALWDWECKAAAALNTYNTTAGQQTIFPLLDMPQPHALTTAFTLSLDSPEAMLHAAQQNSFRPLLKIKLGGADISMDLARIRGVRQGAPLASIIVDANEGWTPESYQIFLPVLVENKVSLIEQPFRVGDDDALSSLPRPIPICADESCHDTASLAPLIGKYDFINIKLDKTGGLTEALALKQTAIESGFQIMVGCMVASSLSMAPAFVLAQSAPIVDLDGALLLAKDIEDGFIYQDNVILPASAKLWG